MVFNKKTLRDLKKEFLRYLLIIIVMVLGIGVSVAYTNVYESVKSTVLDNWEECNVEDGEFAMYMPLDDDQKKISKIKEQNWKKLFTRIWKPMTDLQCVCSRQEKTLTC